MDELRRAIKTDFSLRVVAAVTTRLVAEASERHGLRGVEVVALGRALTAGCLLTTLTKHASERVRVELRSSGPLRGLLVDARGDGSVRGCLQRHLSSDEHAQLGARAPGLAAGLAAGPVAGPAAALAGSFVGAGRVAVAPAVGQHGTVTVTRDLGLDQRYQGSVEVASGEVDVDLEHYLNASEQLPSVLACEVILDRDGKVLRAAGLLCQTFPDGDTAELEQLRGVLAAGNLADLLRHDRSCREIIGFSLGGEAFDDMGASPLCFRCGCGPERARQIVSTLGAEDIEALADEQPQTEVRCEYCGTVYALDSAALRALAAEIRRGRS